ncbi:uncharacterized protein LOC127287486 [Leptopilina boulardi]|uniref:uncharacterized protein LOC127287486 n=1 Tax=Leptopilina boulardi TaxID=63433 RepID=UPI0021F5798D|nr:uncharacterized protein LOC127287486 [Leptopilina boulardi]
MRILLWCALILSIKADVHLKNLEDTTIFAENLGITKLFHETWKLILGIDTNNFKTRLAEITEIYSRASALCNNCSEKYELNLLRNRINRLENSKFLLNQILGQSRQRRGLFNFMGSFSKTLFGTLDDHDLQIINNEFDAIYKDNNIMAESIGNQTRIIKTLLNSASHDLQLLNEQSQSRTQELNKIINSTNENQKRLLIANLISAVEIAVAEYSEDLNLVIDAINDGRHGIVHPQILTPETLIQELRQIEESDNQKYPIKLIVDNYQHIIDISETTIGIVNKRLVYILKIPVLEHEDLQTYHLIPIPIPHGKSFIAPIPSHEVILTNLEKNIYVPSDVDSLKLCKEIDELRICKRTQPSYFISETHSCETSIIRRQNKHVNNDVCQFSAFRILELVFIPLKDPNQYVLVPEVPFELNVWCGTNTQTLKLNSASLLFSDEDCIIQTPKSILKLRKSKVRRSDIYFKKNVTYKLSIEDINLLSSQLPLIQESLRHENFKELRQSLNNMENSLKAIKSNRRTRTWIETSTDILTYLGYLSLCIISVYSLYKIGLFDCIRKSLPRNFCIKLFCVSTTVTSTPTVQYTPVATAPIEHFDTSLNNVASNKDVVVVQKRIKLRT